MSQMRFNTQTTGVLLDNETVQRWSSHDGRRAYTLTLRWPSCEAPTGGFPLVLMLDGAWVTEATVQAGVGMAVALLMHEGDAETVKASRAFDFTPPVACTRKLADPRTPRWRNGGADAFLELLDALMLPWVLAQAPIDPARITLFGHSYGALCVLRGLYNGALGQVDRCVLASPSVWWHDGAVDQALPQMARIGDSAGGVLSVGASDLLVGAKRITLPAVLFLAGEHERWHALPVGPDGTARSREGGQPTVMPIRQAALRWAATGSEEVYLAVVPQGTHHSMLTQSVAPAFEFARQPRATLGRAWRRVDRWEFFV